MNFKQFFRITLYLAILLLAPFKSFAVVQNYDLYSKKVIKSVHVTGLPSRLNIPIDTLLTKPGQRLIVEFLEKDTSFLYKTGLLQSVSVDIIPTQNQVLVLFNCVPNPKIKKIIIRGNSKISSKKLEKLMKNKPNQILNMSDLNIDKNTLEAYYKDKGYELFQISKVEITSKNSLVIETSEGTIEDISFQGLNKMSSKILLKSMESQNGKPFNSETLRRDRERLLRLGYFSEIPSPLLKEGINPNSVKVIFTVKEKKANRIDVGLEQEQEQFVGFTKLSRNHALIPGDNFSGKIQLGTLNTKRIGINSYSAQYFQPLAFNRYPFSLSFDFWEDLKQEIAPNQFHRNNQIIESTDRIGESFTIGIPFKQDILTLYTKFKNEKVSPRESSTFPEYNIHSVSMILSYRNTNSFFNPKSGNYGKIEYEKGGDLGLTDIKGINFSRLILNGAHFIPLGKKSTVGAHATFGIFDTQNDSTFDTESFVIGGVNSIRGYNENDYPFYGSRKIVYNIEYRYDLTPKTQIIAFVDAGKTFNSSWSFTSNLHTGKGLGVRFFTPVGPIRLDVAKGEGDIFIHLGLGQMF